MIHYKSSTVPIGLYQGFCEINSHLQRLHPCASSAKCDMFSIPPTYRMRTAANQQNRNAQMALVQSQFHRLEATRSTVAKGRFFGALFQSRQNVHPDFLESNWSSMVPSGSLREILIVTWTSCESSDLPWWVILWLLVVDARKLVVAGRDYGFATLCCTLKLVSMAKEHAGWQWFMMSNGYLEGYNGQWFVIMKTNGIIIYLNGEGQWLCWSIVRNGNEPLYWWTKSGG